MISNIEKGLQEIWDIKEELYSDYKISNFTNYYDFIKNEIKDLEFEFYDEKEGIELELK